MLKRHFLIIEALLKHEQGLTRDELNQLLILEGEMPFERKGFQKAITSILHRMDVRITSHNCGKNIWRYRIDRTALEDYDREQLIGNLLANMMQADFLLQFRHLGSKIQPLIIPRGTEYLRPIGTALEHNLKLHVTYHKFGEEPYQALLHPYCLKVFSSRWYLFAFKENSEHPDARLQCFALDRFTAITVTTEPFTPDTTIDPQDYFRDAFGIWVDPDHYPVRTLHLACTPKVANYLRSLPLHHTQKELTPDEKAQWMKQHNKELSILNCQLSISESACFTLHLSPTPDFIAELQKWGDEITMI